MEPKISKRQRFIIGYLSWLAIRDPCMLHLSMVESDLHFMVDKDQVFVTVNVIAASLYA